MALVETRIEVRVIPNASQTQCEGMVDGVYRIRLQARPEKGKANKALLLFLAKTLSIKRSQVELLVGETARHKQILVTGLTEEEIHAGLLA